MQLASTITAAGISKADLNSKPPVEALAMLRAKSEIKLALDAYLAITGQLLIGGYCISGKTLQESPNIILARIIDALAPRAETEFDETLQKQLRDQIPAADLEEFDLALSDAREANRMRDERGVYNDIWGVGVARTAILAAGRRLEQKGVLSNHELVLDASHAELLGLLRGESPVTDEILQERRSWRLNKNIDEVPEILGMPPVDPPPLDWLP